MPRDNFLRSILIIVVSLILFLVVIFTYTQINREKYCADWVNNYIKSPPTTIEDYTSKDVAFDELCGEDNYIYVFGGIFMLALIFVGLAKKNKKRDEKIQSKI